MENKPSPIPQRISSAVKQNRVPSAKRWGSSAKPIPSLAPSSREAQEQASETVSKSGLSPKGRPLSSNVYLKKTITQGWKAQEVPELELSPGELDRLVGDEVESLGEKKKALEGMLTSQSLVTGDQVTQTDWVKGEVMIPDFHCSWCRDHFYGLIQEPCEEEQERILREQQLRRVRGEGGTSPRGRGPREGGGRSPVPPQRREVSGRDQLISDSQEGTTRAIGARSSGGNQQREGDRNLIGGETEEDYSRTKRGVSSGKKLATDVIKDQSGASLVASSSNGSVSNRNRAGSSKNRTVTGNTVGETGQRSGTEMKNSEDFMKSADIRTNAVDSSHSRDNTGNDGLSRGGVGGRGGKKQKGRGRRKGEEDGSDSGSSSYESADGSEGAAGEGKRRKKRGRRGQEGDDRETEGADSETEGPDSAGRGDRGGLSGERGGSGGDSRGTAGGSSRERGIGGGDGIQQERGVNGSAGQNRMSAVSGREGIGIEVMSRVSEGAWRGTERDNPRGERDLHSAQTQRSAGWTGREGQGGQLESPSQLLSKLLSAKRPSTAFPAVSSGYSLALSQPYTFSYYKT